MRSVTSRLLILLLCLAAVAGLLALGAWGLRRLLLSTPEPTPQPVTQGCLATVDGTTAFLSPEQSKWASIIVAESIRRGLPARAATIALATAMQESSLRNIDYGDRDSVGLFQQRPSQGWGSVEQIMDPWYSSGKFYEVLVTIENWQTGDINDVAQAVQRSGVPEGYRKHVEEARVLASTLTGHSAAALTCVVRDSATPQPSVLPEIFERGLAGGVTVERAPDQWTITADDPTTAWAAAHLAMANLRDSGLRSVNATGAGGSTAWTMDPVAYAPWTASTPVQPTTITLGF
ncbi:hypothetical protein ACPCG0_11915 [Propionibacteriaceae bacterium Y1923]